MSRLRDEIEQLTARLTTDPMTHPSHPEVVVLLMGHLPVRAGLWRLPATRRLLPDAGSIVVVRREDNELFIECIGDVGGNIEQDGGAMLECLPLDTTLVLVPASGSGPDDIADLHADRIGLVTGCDQAATAGAYRMLKSMNLPRGMEIDLVVAGSEGDAIEETVSQLSEALDRHLNVKIRLHGAIPKIEADTGLTQSAVVACPAGGLSEVVRRVRRRSQEGTQQAAASVRRAVSAGATHETNSSVTPPSLLSPPTSSEPIEYQPVDDANAPCIRLSPAVPMPQWTSTDAAPKVSECQPLSGDVVQKQVGVPVPEQEQASCLCTHLPGLRSLSIQCPDHEAVEFAADAAGAIHLLAACDDVLQIPIVLAWVERHRSLLEMALPDTGFDSQEPPQVHVLGEDVETLCSLRTTSWRPHLLVRVDPTGPSGWASVPLSKS